MRTEKVLALIALSGLILKLLHITLLPAMLLTNSLLAMTIVYFPLGFYFFCDKHIKKQNLALSIISGLFLSTIPVGLLFKIQHWPGAQEFLLIGLVSTPIILAIVYYLKSKMPEHLNTYYKNMLNRTLVLCALTTVFYFTPTATLIKIQHWEDPELARLKTQFYVNPHNEEYKREYDTYVMKRDSLNKTK